MDSRNEGEFMDDSFVEARYLTDDRDLKERNELVILLGGNGDWYVGVVPEGEGCLGRMVRHCTSGGASFEAPGLTVAISEAYRAILKIRCPACGEPDTGHCRCTSA